MTFINSLHTGISQMELSLATPVQLIPLKAFMSSVTPIDSFSWPKWITSKLVGAPLWWSMGKIGLVDTQTSMTEARAWSFAKGDWVVFDTLKVIIMITNPYDSFLLMKCRLRGQQRPSPQSSRHIRASSTGFSPSKRLQNHIVKKPCLAISSLLKT